MAMDTQLFSETRTGSRMSYVSPYRSQDPIKLIRLRLRNIGPQQRRLSATFFVEWVLGVTRDRSAMHVVTELDPDTGALLARNAFQEDFGRRVAFADVNRRPTTVTADRVEFLGRHGSTTRPTAFDRVALSGRTGAALDPCAAIQTTFLLEPQESTELIFVLGEAADLESAHALIRKYWEPGETEKAIGDSGATVGPDPVGCPGSHSRPSLRSDHESMATVSGHQLPALGPFCLLPIRRRLRISRPASRCDGTCSCRA